MNYKSGAMSKIVFIADTLPFCHEQFSGAELTCEYVSKETFDDVFYLTSKRDYDCKEKVYELPKSHSKEFPIDVHIIIDIIRIFKKEKPEYAYLYTKKYLQPAVMACFILHIPIVYSVVDYHILCPTNILKCNGELCKKRRGIYCRIRHIWFILLIKLICRTDGLFWTFTRTSENRLEEWGIPPKRIVVRYQMEVPDHVEPIKLLKPSVVFVGSYHPHKGIDVVVETFRLLMKEKPDIYFYMIGDDAFHQFEGIKTIGHITHDSVLKYIKGADAVIVTEQWYSDFGNVVAFEASQMGVPVIAGNIGSAHEFTSHIVQYDDPHAFKREVLKVLHDKDC